MKDVAAASDTEDVEAGLLSNEVMGPGPAAAGGRKDQMIPEDGDMSMKLDKDKDGSSNNDKAASPPPSSQLRQERRSSPRLQDEEEGNPEDDDEDPLLLLEDSIQESCLKWLRGAFYIVMPLSIVASVFACLYGWIFVNAERYVADPDAWQRCIVYNVNTANATPQNFAVRYVLSSLSPYFSFHAMDMLPSPSCVCAFPPFFITRDSSLLYLPMCVCVKWQGNRFLVKFVG